MNVKTVSVLLILVVLVAGIAVNGSRAQPMPGTSVAFQQCLEGSGETAERCRSLVAVLAAMEEVGVELGGSQVGDVGGSIGGDIGGDMGGFGGDLESPEFWRDVATRVLDAFLGGLIKAFVRHLVGSSLPMHLDAQVDPALFDPIR
jgi:hypothetical protein